MTSGFEWIGVLNGVLTIIAFAAFVGVVAWAYSARRKPAFDEAARAPFALPDDAVTTREEARR